MVAGQGSESRRQCILNHCMPRRPGFNENTPPSISLDGVFVISLMSLQRSVSGRLRFRRLPVVVQSEVATVHDQRVVGPDS